MNFPDLSVMAPFTDPFTLTLTPIKGLASWASLTTPDTCLLCANASFAKKAVHKRVENNTLLIMFILSLKIAYQKVIKKKLLLKG
ncbi:hypothetical protein D3C72_2102180 [compost metagenome]